MRGIEEYKAVNISSASKEELVLMLYEAAVRHQLAAAEFSPGRIRTSPGTTCGGSGHLRRTHGGARP